MERTERAGCGAGADGGEGRALSTHLANQLFLAPLVVKELILTSISRRASFSAPRSIAAEIAALAVVIPAATAARTGRWVPDIVALPVPQAQRGRKPQARRIGSEKEKGVVADHNASTAVYHLQECADSHVQHLMASC